MSKYELYLEPGGLMASSAVIVGKHRRWWLPKEVARFKFRFPDTDDLERARREAKAWIEKQESDHTPGGGQSNE